MYPLRRIGIIALLGVFGLSLTSCVILVRKLDVTAIDPDRRNVLVQESLRIHTETGEVILYPDGANFGSDTLYGVGKFYGLNTARYVDSVVTAYPIEKIAAIEQITDDVDAGASAAATILATPVAALGTAALLVAIFGSCPTLYTVQDTSAVLEAEMFSSSLAPLMEMRDVDRLGADADEEGLLRLELRNEALETHYINHFELIGVEHEPEEVAVADDWGDIWLLKDLTAPERAWDRVGRDVTDVFAGKDSLFFSTDNSLLESIHEEDFTDQITLVYPPMQSDIAALYIRLRNSLLSTVLFYDFLLDDQGVNSINWMAENLKTVAGTVELGQFFLQMNLRVEVWDGNEYVEQDQIGHIGPIAWDELVVPVDVLTDDSLRVRLQLVADAWRIDHVLASSSMRQGEMQNWGVDRVLDTEGVEQPAFMERMSQADEDYAITFPGHKYTLEFNPGLSDADRTFFLAGQGYYIEWVRGSWIQDDIVGNKFIPSDSTMVAALNEWYEVKESFEKQFFESKIPVE